MARDDKKGIKTNPQAAAGPKPTKDCALDGRAPSSPIHELLGMTPQQVREETIAQGEDPAAVVEAMRRLGRVMAAKYAGQIDRESALATLASQRAPIFEEAVAAGAPAWAGCAESSRSASLMDIFGRDGTSGVMWVRVVGWSMRDVGIRDGDVLLVDAKAVPKDGDIVVAHLQGQGQVVKRLSLRGGSGATLESANPDFAPIALDDASSLRIHGVVVGRAGKV